MYKHALPLVGGLASLSDQVICLTPDGCSELRCCCQISNNPNGILGTVKTEVGASGCD